MKKPVYSLSVALIVLVLGMFNGAVNAQSEASDNSESAFFIAP